MPLRRAALEVALALVLLALAFTTGLLVGTRHQDAKASAAQSQADQLKGEALAEGRVAQQADQQAMRDQATVTDSDAHAAAAKRELDRRLAALHGGAPASHPSPASLRANGAGSAVVKDSLTAPLPSLPSASDELALTRAALAQAQAVIAAQGDQLAARDRLIASLTASRDAWKADAEKAQQALRLQEIASEARASAQAKRTVWGEIKTGLVTGLVGYAAGRAR